MKWILVLSLPCLALGGHRAQAEPDVLATPVQQFYTNGFLGVPAYGSYAALTYVPGTQLWPSVALAKSWGESSIAILADASPAFVWSRSSDQTVASRLSAATVGVRFSYGIAAADRDTKDFKLQQRCDTPGHSRVLDDECAADAAGAILPGLTLSFGGYAETATLGQVNGLDGDAIAQYTAAPWLTVFVSSTIRWVGSEPESAGQPTLEELEGGVAAGAFSRVFGNAKLGTWSLTAGLSARKVRTWAWGPSTTMDLSEGWASASMRAGNFAITAGAGYRSATPGDAAGSTSIVTRRVPVMITIQYSL